MSILVAPSILAADFSDLRSSIASVIAPNGADRLHLDLMDGVYVPNLSYGPVVIEAIRSLTSLPLEAHLMVSQPEILLPALFACGVNSLIFHPETCQHLEKTLSAVCEGGVAAGLALNPAQPISLLALEEIGHLLTTITVMSVNPGFGGQKFLERSVAKVARLKQELKRLKLEHIEIEVDGGVGAQNAKALAQAGATVLVAGNSVFRTPNPLQAILEIKAQAEMLV